MAITMYEKFGSRQANETTGPGSREQLRYVMYGTSNDLAIKAHLEANAPPTYDGLVAENYTIEQVGPDLWDAVVSYVDPARKQEAPLLVTSYTYDFDMSGGTFHISHGLAVRSYPTSALSHNGAINVRHGSAEGIDIVVPMMRVSIRKRVPRAIITDAYLMILEGLAGKVNDAPFRGRAKGEVLFLGPSGTQGTEVDPEVSYQFMVSRNVTGLTIGTITGIEKKGHEYLWVDYEDDPAATGLSKKPRAVYVHQVYEYGDFSLLSI